MKAVHDGGIGLHFMTKLMVYKKVTKLVPHKIRINTYCLTVVVSSSSIHWDSGTVPGTPISIMTETVPVDVLTQYMLGIGGSRDIRHRSLA